MSLYGYVEPDLEEEKIGTANKKYEDLTKEVVDILYKIMEDEKEDNRRRIVNFPRPTPNFSAHRLPR